MTISHQMRILLIVLFLGTVVISGWAASGRSLVNQGNRLFNSPDSAKRAEALEKYLEAREKRRERFEIPFNIGSTYLSFQRNGEAATWLEEAARSNDRRLRADAHFQQGNLHFVGKQWDKAIKQYTEALRNNPADSGARRNLELALWQKRLPPPDSSQQNQNEQKQQEPPPDSTQQPQPQKDKLLEQARNREADTQRQLLKRRNQGEAVPIGSGRDW